MLLALTTLLGLAWLLPCIHAQTFKPSGLPNPINSYIDKQALFIAGGYRNSSTGPRMTQLFAIDLSVSWDSSDPTFKKLPDSPLLYYGPSTISADGKQWIVVDNSTAYAYDIEKATWSTLVQHDLTVVDQIAATDPDTGFIYIPATNNNYLMRLNVTSRSYDRLIINKNVSETNDFSAAWSAFQKKLFIIGGRHGADNPTQLIMFSYNDTAGWANLTMDAKGEVPGPRHSACLVPAFGGADGSVRNSTIVFNLNTNKWTSAYSITPGPSMGNNGTGTPDGTQSSSGGLSLDASIAIIALSVGSVALSVGGFLLYRMRRKHSREAKQDISYELPGHNSQESLAKDTSGHGKRPPGNPQQYPTQFSYRRNGPQALLWTEPPQNPHT
ncbi:hypothetical protein B0O80DRAFT_424348 [Mortierella sp. GBAus27b]|nr:hypothetical protein B0O80DRAFT_424348 [Mortierella sp. GBAus27b]